MDRKLFFHLETRARPEAVALLPVPHAPTNYKDPEEIAAYIAEKRTAQIREAALDPDTGEIIALGLRLYPEASTVAVYTRSDCDEGALLKAFWDSAAEAEGWFVGYNLLAFDLPYLLRRSMALGVQPTLVPILRRDQLYPILDLYGLLFNWQPGKPLATVAKLYGLPNGCAVGEVEVSAMDDEILRTHLQHQVQLTVALYERMAGYYLPSLNDEFPF